MPARRRRRRRPFLGVGALLMVVALTSACTIPSLEQGPVTNATPTLLGASPTNPLAPVVRALIDEMIDNVEATRDGLAKLSASASTDEIRAAAATAARRLSADERFGAGAEPAERPLLPGPVSRRNEVVDTNDLLSDALTAAREVGGDRLLGVLSDPIAGDLGTWQRDPGGLYDEVENTIDEAARQDLEEMDETVSSLDGQALRALVWAELAARTESADQGLALIQRAAAHLDIILASLESLAGPEA